MANIMLSLLAPKLFDKHCFYLQWIFFNVTPPAYNEHKMCKKVQSKSTFFEKTQWRTHLVKSFISFFKRKICSALYPEKMILYFPLHFSLLCGERRQLQPNNSFWEMGLWNLFVIFTWRRIERCHDVIAKRGKILKSFSTTQKLSIRFHERSKGSNNMK